MSSALNEYFQEQAKVEGKCLVDYVQFGSDYEVTYEDRPVAQAEAVFNIRGMTALYDAVGRGVNDLGFKLKALNEHHRPGKVQVVIVTDGYENASREFGQEAVKELISQQEEKYGWDFVFLGANIDAVAFGQSFGVNPDKAITFDIHSDESVMATSQSLATYSTTYRGGGQAKFSAEDREKALGKS